MRFGQLELAHLYGTLIYYGVGPLTQLSPQLQEGIFT